MIWTELYGMDYLAGNSPNYYKTKWLCIFYIPIFPIRSYVVFDEQSKTSFNYIGWIGIKKETSYVLQKTKLFKKQTYWIQFWQLIFIAFLLVVFLRNYFFIIPLLVSIIIGYLYIKEKNKYEEINDLTYDIETLMKKFKNTNDNEKKKEILKDIENKRDLLVVKYK